MTLRWKITWLFLYPLTMIVFSMRRPLWRSIVFMLAFTVFLIVLDIIRRKNA